MIITLRYDNSGTLSNCESKLAGTISASATSFSVTSGDGVKFPTYFPFLVICESEIMVCSGRSSDTFTVNERGAKGTTAASHTIGKPIRAILYTNDLDLDRIITSDGEVLITDGEVVYNGLS